MQSRDENWVICSSEQTLNITPTLTLKLTIKISLSGSASGAYHKIWESDNILNDFVDGFNSVSEHDE